MLACADEAVMARREATVRTRITVIFKENLAGRGCAMQKLPWNVTQRYHFRVIN